MRLEKYIPIIKFIGDFLGEEAEVILYNAIEGKVEFIHNSLNPEIQINSPIQDIEKQLIEQKVYETEDSIMNYRAFSADRKKLRSASHFIKDKENKLIGVITINYKVDELIELRSILNRLISGSDQLQKKTVDYYESFDLSFKDMMYHTIQDVLSKYKVPPERLSQEEKIDLIRTLDEKGIFLLKGSVAELAKILNSSEASVYRYINKI